MELLLTKGAEVILDNKEESPLDVCVEVMTLSCVYVQEGWMWIGHRVIYMRTFVHVSLSTELYNQNGYKECVELLLVKYPDEVDRLIWLVKQEKIPRDKVSEILMTTQWQQ